MNGSMSLCKRILFCCVLEPILSRAWNKITNSHHYSLHKDVETIMSNKKENTCVLEPHTSPSTPYLSECGPPVSSPLRRWHPWHPRHPRPVALTRRHCSSDQLGWRRDLPAQWMLQWRNKLFPEPNPANLFAAPLQSGAESRKMVIAD